MTRLYPAFALYFNAFAFAHKPFEFFASEHSFSRERKDFASDCKVSRGNSYLLRENTKALKYFFPAIS